MRRPVKKKGTGHKYENTQTTDTESVRCEAIPAEIGRVCHASVEAVPPYELRITNVVATGWAGSRVPLRLVQLATQGRLDVSVFPSSVSRARKPTTTNSLFYTGKILVTGASSSDCALLSALCFVAKINSVLATDFRVINFKVQNVVTSFATGFVLNVDMFYRDQKCTSKGQSHYDPSMFRGCSWRRTDGVVLVIFLQGCVVLTGARTWEQAHAVYLESLELLKKYKLGSEYKPFDSSCRRTRLVDLGKASISSKAASDSVLVKEEEQEVDETTAMMQAWKGSVCNDYEEEEEDASALFMKMEELAMQ